jgi:hypothetical protein
MANAFFADLGFLQKSGATYVPCAEVVSFNRAHEWNPETAPHKLAPIVQQSWFGEAILPRLAFASITEREAIEALAEAAAVGTERESQLSILVSYLTAVGLVILENGTRRRRICSTHGRCGPVSCKRQS